MMPLDVRSRRAYERQLREQGNARTWSAKQANSLTPAQCRAQLPLLQRLLVLLGVRP